MCPSPAVDVTYHVESLALGATNRVSSVAHRPGGKAINVARVLATLGEPVTVLAPLSGETGAQVADGLTALGIPVEAVPTAAPTRRTVTVVDATGAATVLSEPARVSSGWADLTARFATLVARANAVVISGSLPIDAPPDALAVLVEQAHARGRPVVVDTSGPALAEVMSARPTLVKPNADELAELAGDADPHSAAARLARTHRIGVVASLGPNGLVAVDERGAWHARPARPLDGNPTGAGDAVVAALARGLARNEELPDILADAVAVSAAAVLQPHAGDIDVDHVDAQRRGVVVARLSTDGVA